MKRQILFSLVMLVAVSCMPLQAVDKQEQKSKNTLTGKSTETLVKAAFKIGGGGILIIWGLFGGSNVAVPKIQNGAEAVAVLIGATIGLGIRTGMVYLGGRLIYSGAKDLNEEESEDTVKVK